MQRFFSVVALVQSYSVTYGSEPAVKTLLLCSGALLFSLSAMGCAASAASDDDGTDGGPTYDAPVTKDTGTDKDTGLSQCDMLLCTSDLDCQNTCPPVSNGGVECCDISTQHCYAYPSMCPAPVVDAGFD
jgi:hypothetical protein